MVVCAVQKDSPAEPLFFKIILN